MYDLSNIVAFDVEYSDVVCKGLPRRTRVRVVRSGISKGRGCANADSPSHSLLTRGPSMEL